MNTPIEPYKYDLTVSFAGEDREYVEEIVWKLRKEGIRIFYDIWEQADLWGKDLYQHLDSIYRKSAQYCLIFVSRNYIKKAWTKHELKAAQARAFSENSEYILPVLLDDTELPGLPPTIGYIEANKVSKDELCRLFIKKFRNENHNKNSVVSNESVYPFEYEYTGMETIMFPDGSFEIIVEQNILSRTTGLHKIQEKVNLSGDSKFNHSSVSVWGETSRGRVSHQIISDSDNFKLCNVIFEPSLDSGDAAHYCVKYTNKSGFLMNQEAILKQIAKGQWPFEKAYEYTSFGVKYPAKIAMFRLIFPLNFEISFDEFWGVALDHSYEPWRYGMENVKDKGIIRSYKNSDNQMVFELIDNQPKIGANYFFKWLPPSER